MKKLIFIVSALLLTVSISFAQERSATQDRIAKARAAVIAQEFQLTADQQAIVDTAIYDRLIAHASVVKGDMTPEEKNAAMKPIGAKFNNTITGAFGQEKGREILKFYTTTAIKVNK